MPPLAAILGFLLCPGTLDNWDGLRSRIASAGDVNCDGTPDLLVADRESDLGLVSVLCGRDGAPLLSVSGDAPEDGFGCSLSGAGDVDLDGHADFIVGALRQEGSEGYAVVFSGGSGARLHRLHSDREGDWFGACVAGGGDVDGDGLNDLAVATNGSVSGSASVHLFSGRDGHLLGEREEIGVGRWMAVAICPDLNGDRRAELVSGLRRGLAEVRRGVGMEPLARFSVRNAPRCFGQPSWAIATGGDADADGTPDVVMALIDCGFAVFSGRTFEPLLLSDEYWSHSRWDIIAGGSSVDWIGDIDLDGHDDFVLAANESDRIADPGPGFTRMYSGCTGELLHSYEPAGKRMDACRAGDANLDGIPDLAVFVVEDQAVRVLSGSDLHVIWEVPIDDLRR